MRRIVFYLGLTFLAIAFSCKAPTTSTTSGSNSQSNIDNGNNTPSNPTVSETPSVDIGSTQNLFFPIWWVEEGYQNKPGSPTVIVFKYASTGGEIYARTRTNEGLAKIGTYGTSGNTAIIGGTNDVKFGVDADGNWSHTVIYKGKKLVRGKQDITLNLLDGKTYKGLGSLYNDGPYSWAFYGEFILDKYDGILKFYYGAGQIAKTTDEFPDKKNPAQKEIASQRYFNARVSDLGDTLILTGPNWVPTYLNNKQITFEKVRFIYNVYGEPVTITLKSNNVFAYDKKTYPGDTSGKKFHYEERRTPNNGTEVNIAYTPW